MSAPLVAEKTLIDQLLEDQQEVPVSKFSKLHERDALDDKERYRDLIPLTKPGVNEQYAFEVDIDQCTGCKGCVTACHSLNGLDENEAWRDVGMLYGGDAENPAIQTITTACHHCLDPECLNGCPVEAYDKDTITGIVRHLDDQCIGCQYCVLKCPYDVPKYNESKGIVRKCDMCHNRLAVGEAPACVQACPNEAIHIVKVETSQVEKRTKRTSDFLPGTPDPAITKPTTVYKTEKGIPANMQPADVDQLKKEPAHMPLVIMLTFTQFAVGLFGADMIQRLTGSGTYYLATIAFCMFIAGLTASFLHLGQPLKAWRFFLGLKKSWLSREILAFNLMLPPVMLLLAADHLGDTIPFIKEYENVLSILSYVLGILAVFTSVMIYHDTKRPLWNFRRSARLFYGTVMIGFSIGMMIHGNSSAGFSPAFLLTMIVGYKLFVELSIFIHLREEATTPLKKTALLMSGELRKVAILRYSILIVAGIVIPLLLGDLSAMLVLVIALLLIFSELLERYLFFTTVSKPKMPGHA